MNIQQAIARLCSRGDLAMEEAREVMGQIMEGQATDAQIGAYLVGLRMKGETVDEIAGSAQAMREKSLKVKATGTVLDTCGTGGDGSGTFNISTCTALVVAACGVTVAKHGNRAISSLAGSADVLAALGVDLEVTPAVVERCLEQAGIGFLFAPRHHGAMRFAMGPRKELAIRTLFNLLGPLTNPAGAACQLLGVFDQAWVVPLAEVLGRLGSRRALVVHGADGLDEITTTDVTHAAELREDGTVVARTLTPEAFGLVRCAPEALRGGDAQANAEDIRAILGGALGSKREIVLFNAGAALYVAGRVESIEAGIVLAAQAIDQGRARETLHRLVALSGAYPSG